MKKRVILLTAALLSLSLLCSCTLSLAEQDGKLIDKKNGVTYLGAPICFEPSNIDSEVYARCKKLKIELYPITGQPTSEWLSEPYDGIGGVWYADTITLPTLEEFDADELYICVESVITTALGVVTDKADIDAVADSFINGTPVNIVNSGKSYKLKFASEKYPGIFYNLLYIVGDDGKNYIYDRSTKTCVEAGDVLAKYISGETQ